MKRTILIIMLLCAALVIAGCSCKHKETYVKGVVEATCAREGYTGSKYCKECDELVEMGDKKPMTEHTPGEIEGVIEATCTEEGYTGDIKCAVCGEVLTAGEAVPAAGHVPGEVEGVIEASCTEEGYTGDIKCTVCGEVVEAGEVIAAAGHVPGEVEGAVEATCTEDGYTVDIRCEVCGEIVEEGVVLPATGHSFDDGECEICGEPDPDAAVEEPEVVAEDAGLYLFGKLMYTWDELIEKGFVEVDDDVIVDVTSALKGRLVAPVEITAVADGVIEETKIEEVVIYE